MILFITLSILLPSALAADARHSSEFLPITNNYFHVSSVIYTSNHEISKIFVPLNRNNYRELANTKNTANRPEPLKVFFVEANLLGAKEVPMALYVIKGGKAIKVLDNGTDVVATHDNTIIIGATDGIYKFDDEKNTAVRIGEVRNNIEKLAFNNKTNKIVCLSGNTLYALSDDFNGISLMPAPYQINSIIYDYDGNLYGISNGREVFVYKKKKRKKIAGLPTANNMVLFKQVFSVKDSVYLFVNGDVYVLKPDGTYDRVLIRLEMRPTAFAPEASYFQYYAVNKKLYKIKVFEVVS